MTTGTILNVVPLGQRKEVMSDALGIPTLSRHVVAFRTIGGKTRLRVIRIGGSVVILCMAVHAGISQSVKSQH